MSGIAELLANLGYVVSGSDATRSSVTDRLETLGIRILIGHAAEQVGEAEVVVVSSAVKPTNPEVARSRSAADSGDPAGRDARGADAPPLRDCGRRRAREDDGDVDDCAGARTGRPRSDGGHRRAAERVREQRPSGTRRAHGRRGGRKRSIVSSTVSNDCRDHQHRPRTSRKLRRIRRAAAGVRRFRQQGAVLRRGRRLRRRPASVVGPAARDPSRDHLRTRLAARGGDGRRDHGGADVGHGPGQAPPPDSRRAHQSPSGRSR